MTMMSVQLEFRGSVDGRNEEISFGIQSYWSLIKKSGQSV